MTSFNFADTVGSTAPGRGRGARCHFRGLWGVAWEVLVKSFGLRKQYHNIRQKTVYFSS